MTTTLDDLRIDVHDPPSGGSPGLLAVIDLAEEAIQASVLLLASGKSSNQPDLMARLKQAKLLSSEGLDDNTNTSVMADNYSSRLTEVNSLKSDIKAQNADVDSESYAAFNTSNRTFQAVTDDVDDLNRYIDETPVPTEQHRAPFVEIKILEEVLNTVDSVHDRVEMASHRMQEQAGLINNAVPTVPSLTGVTPVATVDSHTNASYVETTLPGAAGDAIRIAEKEIGVRETGNNIVKGKEYNIGDAWCSSFATWAWDKAGIKVNWSNKNLVSAVWKDAQTMKPPLSDSVANAKPGDLIIFPNSSHIGIVKSVNGSTITTIEGNSSDAVQQNTYNLNSKGFVGVVHPPPTANA